MTLSDIVDRREDSLRTILAAWGHLPVPHLVALVSAYMSVDQLDACAARAQRDLPPPQQKDTAP